MEGYGRQAFAVGKQPSSPPDLLGASATARAAAQAAAQAQSTRAWEADWTWSFGSHNTPRGGGFTRAEWQANRTGTCRASLIKQLATSTTSIRNISLCNPPPTAALGQLCSTLVGAMTSIAGRSCQRDGGCVGDRALFYLPYQWVPSNNEYAGQTVAQYYQVRAAPS